MKKVFLSFADSRLSRSLDRIRHEAESLDFYDEIYCWDESALDQQFRESFAEKLDVNVRGYGYWVWKPQAILQALRKMDDGDLLEYADVGFRLNPRGMWRLEQYFEIARKSASGVLGFQGKRPEYPLKDDGRDLPTWPDRYWVKGDLLDYFGVRENREILDTPTIQAGLLFIRKSPQSVAFVEKWLSVFEKDFHLVDDSPSISPNLNGFREHRHDQSVFTILGKLQGIETVSSNEFWYPQKWISQGDWKMLSEFPLQARRDLDFGFLLNTSHKLKKLNTMINPRNLVYSFKLLINRFKHYSN